MLHLLAPTPERWAEAAISDLPRLLADHAHCELKAAQSALSLLGRFGAECPSIIEPLSALAREETQHFRHVCSELDEVQSSLGYPVVDEYVRSLQKAARSDHRDAPIFLDRLLVSALIEARSCERFKLLAEALDGQRLGDFYRGLMVAEARHFALFRDLAEHHFGADGRSRLKLLAEREAEIAHQLPLGPTVHG